MNNNFEIGNTKISGFLSIHRIRRNDDRGHFERIWDNRTANHLGLNEHFDQWSISYNIKKHTLRGLHFTHSPHQETKLVQCINGKIFDVVVDLRAKSPTYGHWISNIISEQDTTALYIPPGCAHGFLTMESETTLLYGISPGYAPSHSAGIRWNDPDIAIEWPNSPLVISETDSSLPFFADMTPNDFT